MAEERYRKRGSSASIRAEAANLAYGLYGVAWKFEMRREKTPVHFVLARMEVCNKSILNIFNPLCPCRSLLVILIDH